LLFEGGACCLFLVACIDGDVMIDFVQLRQRLDGLLRQDRSVYLIDAEGPTLKAAVTEAATLLDIPVRRVEYEVVERGSPGFLGAGRKNWKIHAYERITGKEKEESGGTESGDFDAIFEQKSLDKNGEAFVQLIEEGAMLKVTPPAGNGKPVSYARVKLLLEDRAVKEIDEAAVKAVIQNADGKYARVGGFEHNQKGDAKARLEIVDGNMKALLSVTAPGFGGYDLNFDYYMNLLTQNRVYYGIKEDFLKEFADRPVYREAVVVAEGLKPNNGRDAYIQYNFETDQKKIKIKEEAGGGVDFKNLNLIQNVVEGQPLAKMILAEKGVPGRNLTGEPLPATDGKDIAIPTGNNVKIAEDGLTVIATKNGQVVMTGEKINVESVYLVKGNVNNSTGNIDFLGSVIITGNVGDGFSVKAAGNIEIRGAVEGADIEAVGDITIHQGVVGKGVARIHVGRSVWARFLENATVQAGNMVMVSDGIVNSHVDAFQRIVVRGKRPNIVGGHLRASHGIYAGNIGNISGTETVCETGFDLKTKLFFDALVREHSELEVELVYLQQGIQTLVNIKKQRKTLPDEKEIELKEMLAKRQTMINAIQEQSAKIAELKEQLENESVPGKISVEANVYAGVKITIRDITERIRNDQKNVTFVLAGDSIRGVKYQGPDEEGLEAPNGGSTD
jgi:uncharacterized protein (DUF342 family)